jgi:hypothetical protein
MKYTYASTVRETLITGAVLFGLLAATAGCTGDQPLMSSHDHPPAFVDGSAAVGSEHVEAAATPNADTAADSAGRGPGTIGSGH